MSYLKISIWLLLWMAVCPIYSQTAEIDSLKQVLAQKIESDSAKVDVLIRLCDAYHPLSPNLAKKYGNEALAVAKEIGSLELVAASLQNCGIAYSNSGDYEKALTYYIEAIKLNEQLGQEGRYLDNLNNIASVYFFQGDHTQALAYCTQALNYEIEHGGDTFRIANNHANIGNVFQGMKDYDKALLHYQKALLKFRQLGLPVYEARILFNIGMLVKKQGNYDGAYDSFSQALEKYERKDYLLGIADVHSHLGEMCIYLKKYQLANTHLTKALSFAQKGNFPREKKDVYRYFSRLDSIQGRFGSALTRHHQYIAIRDSLQSEKTKQKIAQLTTQYELDQKEQEVHLLQRESALQEAEIQAQETTIQNQSWLVLALILMGLIIAILGGRLFYTQRQLSRANQLLIQQSEEDRNLIQNQNHWLSVFTDHFQNPIRFIQNTISFINKRNLNPQEVETMMMDLESRAKYASTTFDNLLYWTQFELEELNPRLETANIGFLLNGIQTFFSSDIERKGLQLIKEINLDENVRIDQEMFHLVLRNVLGNAIEFSPPEGNLLIQTGDLGDHIQISVEDEGASISEEQLSLLFESQLPSTVQDKRLAHGRAIGMWLSRHFMQKNHGDLRIENLLRGGMAFHLLIPVVGS